ncbi:sensor histidine kinase [Actinocorallia populi]|uniref:sensor histidine kinase n=1 Tax=Actinocorallia populi TaxID=2079200 RepID=UPI000D08CA21|nr:histidine kinase [Actinocorallia populi]
MRIWSSAGLVALSVAASLVIRSEPPYRELDALGVVLGVLSVLVLLRPRTAPVGTLAAACAVLAVNAAAGYAATIVHWSVWIALCACFSSYGDRRRRLACVLVFLFGLFGYIALDRDPLETVPGIVMGFLIATVGGDAVHSRRAYNAAAEARLLLEERTRLARELHDALGHAVNVMVMQAAVGRRVFADDPEFAREALGHVETLGRGALQELDQVIQALSPDDEMPLMTDLPALAERVRAAGRELALDIAEVELSPGGSRALNRIVQEAVTNALRHTDTGVIRVSLEQAADGVRLEVGNEGSGFAPPVPGRGLSNMRRRVLAEGGEFHAGPSPDGFLVRAVLPRRAPA